MKVVGSHGTKYYGRPSNLDICYQWPVFFLDGQEASFAYCRRSLGNKNVGGLHSGTWMSQEVSKWLVHGL